MPNKDVSVSLSDIVFGDEYWHGDLRAKVTAICIHPHDGAAIVYSYWSPCGQQENFGIADGCFLYELRDDIRTVWQARGSYGGNDIHCGTFSTQDKANKYVGKNDGKLDPNAHLEHGSGRGIVHSMYVCRIELDRPDFPKSYSGNNK